MSMKVLYVSGAPRLSTRPTTESVGPRSHIVGVVDGFRELGHDVVTYVAGDHVAEAIHGQGSEARMSSSHLRILATDVLRRVYRFRSRRRVSKLLKDATFDLVYERYALFQELGSVAQAKGAFWVLEVNALLAIESTSDRRVTTSRSAALRAERRTLARADLIVAVTDALADEISRLHRIPRSRIMVVPNAVTPRIPERLTFPSEGTEMMTVGFLGMLYGWQNVDVLLEAVSAVTHPVLRCRIAGGGPELASLRANVERLGLSDRVDFLGAIPPKEVPDFLASVDFCFAGHGGSGGMYFSPLKLWEYLAAGRPVLTNTHELVSQLRSDGYPVVLYEAVDPVSVEAGIREVLSTFESLRETAQKTPARVAREHSWRARVADIVASVQERTSSIESVALPLGLGSVTPLTADEVAEIAVHPPTVPFVIGNLNLHGLYIRETDETFRAFCDAADVTLVDGWPVLKMLPSRRHRGSQFRVGSTDWLDVLLERDPVATIVAVGGTAEVAAGMAEFVRGRTKNITWRGYDGFAFASVGDAPNLSEALPTADIVLVGMGMPHQERWILSRLSDIRGAVANVGGCFDYYVGAQRLAPRWMGRLGVEWLYRLVNNPRRLAYRYLVEPSRLLVVVLKRRASLGGGRG